jgi:hypothetical protein
LPKICGNIAPPHGTLAAALALLGACSPEAKAPVAIAAHYVPACAPSAGNAPRELELAALGDFDRSNDSVVILASDASLRRVALPSGTRAAELSSLGAGAYWGSGTLTPDNQLPILLWPRNRACALTRFEAASGAGTAGADAAEGEDDGWSIGVSERLGALVVTGPAGPAAERRTRFVDLSNALEVELDGERGPRRERRAASFSELGDALVLAGGIEANGRVLGDAERFDPRSRRFSGELLALAQPRARHAALELAPGQSLLIGGESASGQALRSVELLAVDASRGALELLATPRVAPRALLLGRNRILVGGGYSIGPGGTRLPIETVEFLSLDLTDVVDAPFSLSPPALDRAFVALGSGAALALGGCTADTGESDCMPCAGGCVSRHVWWIDPQGSPHPLEPLPPALSVARPELVPGAGGRPWLIAAGQLARFDPWLARFVVAEVTRASSAARLLGRPLAIGGGLFAWLELGDSDAELVALYHSQRGPYAQDVAPLLVGGADGVLPHRPATGDTGAGRLAYGTANGLELSGSAAVVSIADTDYATFTLELSLVAGPPPLIQLVAPNGDEDAAFGGFECPWPALDASTAAAGATPAPVRLRVERRLDGVRLEQLVGDVPDEPRPEPCRRALPERVGIQLVGTPGEVTRLGRIEIRRSIDEDRD